MSWWTRGMSRLHNTFYIMLETVEVPNCWYNGIVFHTEWFRYTVRIERKKALQEGRQFVDPGGTYILRREDNILIGFWPLSSHLIFLSSNKDRSTYWYTTDNDQTSTSISEIDLCFFLHSKLHTTFPVLFFPTNIFHPTPCFTPLYWLLARNHSLSQLAAAYNRDDAYFIFLDAYLSLISSKTTISYLFLATTRPQSIRLITFKQFLRPTQCFTSSSILFNCA